MSFPTPPLRPGAIGTQGGPRAAACQAVSTGQTGATRCFCLLLWPRFTRGETEAGNGGSLPQSQDPQDPEFAPAAWLPRVRVCRDTLRHTLESAASPDCLAPPGAI